MRIYLSHVDSAGTLPGVCQRGVSLGYRNGENSPTSATCVIKPACYSQRIYCSIFDTAVPREESLYGTGMMRDSPT